MRKLLMTLILLSSIVSYAQDSSKACYKKAQLQRIAYRIKHSQYCDSVLPEYQQVVMNLEEELELSNKQKVIQDQRYSNLEYVFSTCTSERQALTDDNRKLQRKLKRTKAFTVSISIAGVVGWLLVLL